MQERNIAGERKAKRDGGEIWEEGTRLCFGVREQRQEEARGQCG